MEREQNLLNQPGIIESFKQGYQTVSEKLYLILFPFLFDLFLVFGPKLRIDQLVNSILSALPTPKLAQNLMDQWLTTIEQLKNFTLHYNLFSELRTFPLGIPSLFSWRIFEQSLLSITPVFEIHNEGLFIFLVILFFLLGMGLTTWYYKSIAVSTGLASSKYSFKQFGKNFLHFLGIPITLFLIALGVSLPGMCIISLATVLSPAFASVLYIVLFIVLISIIIPFIFTPHCVVSHEQKLLDSIKQSRLIYQATKFKTSLFILLAFGLSMLSHLLWNLPKDGSWMLIVGAFGHALVSTIIIVSSFHFFKNAHAYVDNLIKNKVEQDSLA